jgi:hypothetical protein
MRPSRTAFTFVSVTAGPVVFRSPGTGEFIVGVEDAETLDDPLVGFVAGRVPRENGDTAELSATGEKVPTAGELPTEACAEFGYDN